MNDTVKCERPCPQCPWRKANQGKPSPGGFFTKKNLTRLWRQLRAGERGNFQAQSCHLTDPSHPDHVAAGAHPNAKAKECPGSVILVKREILLISSLSEQKPDTNNIDGNGIEAYLKQRRRGLSRASLMFWLVQRIQFADQPMFGAPAMPEVDVDDPEIGLPDYLLEPINQQG